MNFFTNLFNILLYQPILNLLVWLYLYIHNFGLAVIIITLLIKIILSPLNLQAIRSQKAIQQIQPKILEIQKKYKDKEKQVEKILNLYKEKKFNPFAGFLPILIQLPILIALFQVFKVGIGAEQLDLLYSFIPRPETIDYMFLGMDLSKPNLVLAAFTALAQYLQTKTMPSAPKSKSGAKDDMAKMSEMMQKQMIFILPIFTFFILWQLPAAMGLYWMVVTVFSIVQQYFVLKEKKHV